MTVDESAVPATGDGRPVHRPPSLPLRALRGLSGAVTVGLVVLAAAVWAAMVLAGDRPGPGTGSVAGHTVAAVLAIALQVVADRRRGPVAALAALTVLPVAAVVLWFFWWI